MKRRKKLSHRVFWLRAQNDRSNEREKQQKKMDEGTSLNVI
jgi:hypothetical protein